MGKWNLGQKHCGHSIDQQHWSIDMGLVTMLTTDKNPGVHNTTGPLHNAADYFEDLENKYALQAG